MKEKDLNFLFNDVPLYTKEKFEVFKIEEEKYQLNEKAFEDFKKYIGISKEKIVTYCHKCKKEFPFDIEVKYINFISDINCSTEDMIITENFKNFFWGKNRCKKRDYFGFNATIHKTTTK